MCRKRRQKLSIVSQRAKNRVLRGCDGRPQDNTTNLSRPRAWSPINSRENTGGDHVARLRFCTSWCRQLATGDGATRTRAISRCYQLLPPWYHPYMILLLLSLACCVGWCVVHERAFFFFRRRLLRCRGLRGGTLLLYMLGLFWYQDHEARESRRGSSHEERAARIRWLSSARRALWQGGVSMCAVVVVCISSLRYDARGFMYIFVALFTYFCI